MATRAEIIVPDIFNGVRTKLPVLVNRARETVPLIEPAIPKPALSFLSIGCGFGATEVLLAQAVGTKSIHLLDGNTLDAKRMNGFHPKAHKPWCDVRFAEALVKANVPDAECHTYTPKRTFDIPAGLDLVISIQSWCFHYPVETYLELAYRVLKPGGVLVVDIRNGTDQEAVLVGRGFHPNGQWVFNKGVRGFFMKEECAE